MDATSPRKHLKIYNLGTRNAIVMKLTTIMYHHKTFNLAEDWGVRQRNGKTFQNKHENQFLSQF